MPRATEWILENLGLVVVVAIAAFSFLRSAFSTLRGGGEKPAPRPRHVEDPEAAERTRRVQEEIRRKIAERRAAANESMTEAPRESEVRREREILPPLMRPRDVQPVDPFGGPMRKVIRRLEAAAEQRAEAWNESEAQEALARQRKLEEQLRALEVARLEERRRAAEIAAPVKRSERAYATREVRTAHFSLREQLRDPQELRRAFVLREVLGPPVGLR